VGKVKDAVRCEGRNDQPQRGLEADKSEAKKSCATANSLMRSCIEPVRQGFFSRHLRVERIGVAGHADRVEDAPDGLCIGPWLPVESLVV